jgi:hypothetical protein
MRTAAPKLLAALLLAALIALAGVWYSGARAARAQAEADDAAIRAALDMSAGRWDALWTSLSPAYQAAMQRPDALRARLERVEGDVPSAGRIPALWSLTPLGDGWRAELRLVEDEATQQIALSILLNSARRITRIEAQAVAPAPLDEEPPARAVRALMAHLERRDFDAAYQHVGQAYRDAHSPEAHAALMADQAALLAAPRPALRQIGYDDPHTAVVIAHHSASSGEQGIVVYSVTREAGGPWRVAMFGTLMAADPTP